MNALRFVTVTLALTTMALGGLAGYAARQAAAIRSTVAATREETSPGSTEAENRIASAKRAETQIAVALERIETRKRQKFRPAPSAATLVQADPTLQALYLEAERGRITREYGLLFEQLNLPRDARRKFIDTQVAHAATMLDLIGAVRGNASGSALRDPAVTALAGQENEKFEREVRALLGVEGYRAMVAYQSAAPVRGIIEKFAGDVAGADPLTRAQAEQLTSAVANTCPGVREGLRSPSRDAIDFAAAESQAAVILSPTQFAVWRQSIDETRWMAAVGTAMNAAAQAHRAASQQP